MSFNLIITLYKLFPNKKKGFSALKIRNSIRKELTFANFTFFAIFGVGQIRFYGVSKCNY